MYTELVAIGAGMLTYAVLRLYDSFMLDAAADVEQEDQFAPDADEDVTQWD